jgi:hypothetical protein
MVMILVPSVHRAGADHRVRELEDALSGRVE